MSFKRLVDSKAFWCILTALFAAAAMLAVVVIMFGGAEGFKFAHKLSLVRSVIESRYVGEVETDTLCDGAAYGMVSAVGDRWSYYMSSDDYTEYKSYIANTSTGIGVTITPDPESGGMLISSVKENSPAHRAGIISGQVMTAVAGKSVLGLNTAAVKALVLSMEGEFSVTLLNQDGSTVDCTVKVETFEENPVSFSLLENGIGYIDIENFEDKSAEKSIAAIEYLASSGAVSLIIDVRDNPGGQLFELVGLLDYILPEGDIFVSVSEDGSEKVYTSDESSLDNMSIAVLINENSYSAAEFFAAALREYDYAVIVGAPSTGKSRSQQTFVLSDGSAVHISTNKYLTPKRVDLAAQGGLIPDISLNNAEGEDTQLQEAVKYLS